MTTFTLSIAGERGSYNFYNLTAAQVASVMRDPKHAGLTAELTRTETVWTGDTAAWAGELQKGGAA